MGGGIYRAAWGAAMNSGTAGLVSGAITILTQYFRVAAQPQPLSPAQRDAARRLAEVVRLALDLSPTELKTLVRDPSRHRLLADALNEVTDGSRQVQAELSIAIVDYRLA
jgi:hypothetical protein